ncbi:MAG: AMP-binding protein [Bacillota bacterium]|nr:AMP-binding protein [Bacillota bacterium]
MKNKIKLHKTHDLKTLKDMLVYNVKHFGDNAAFWVKREKGGEYIEITHEKFFMDVTALGTKLTEMGMINKKIAIVGEGNYEWMVSYFAVTCGLGVAVPIDKELSKDDIMNFIRIAGCDGVIYSDSLSKYFADEAIECKINMNPSEEKEGEYPIYNLIGEGELLLGNGYTKYLKAEVDPDEMRILLFTSGTTSGAKGVMLSHRNIISNVIATNKIVKVYPEDKALSMLPIHHTFGLTIGIMCVLYSGGSIAFCEGLKYIAKNLKESEATLLVAVPLIFESMYGKIIKTAKKNGKYEKLMKGIYINRKLRKMKLNLSGRIFKDIYANFGGKLRLLVTGAAAIDASVIRFFEDIGIQVVQGFGMTECSPLVTGTPDTCDTYGKAGSVGMAIPETEVRIINQDENGVGEIICRGPGVMLGYYENQELTDEIMKNGWLHTGDLGYFDEDGFMYISGRMKNVIITKNGKNVYPEELEFYLNSNPYIAECMVDGIYDEKDDDIKIRVQIYPDAAEINAALGDDVSDDKILELIQDVVYAFNETIPAYKRIKRVVIKKEEFIKTTTKKIKRHENK